MTRNVSRGGGFRQPDVAPHYLGPMETTITHDEAGHRFVAALGGGTAELTYVERDAGTVVFDHTFVPPGLRGGGVAGALAQRALEWARDTGRRVIPVCAYMAGYMQRHPEYEGLLAR